MCKFDLYRRFISEWYAAETMEDFCRRMEMDRREASNLAGYLQAKRGCVLKRMRCARKSAPKQLADEDFIAAWQSSGSMVEFCQRTGLERRYASSRAAALRRRKTPIPLKLMPDGTCYGGYLGPRAMTKAQWQELQLLAEELSLGLEPGALLRLEGEQRERAISHELAAVEIRRRYRGVA